MPSTTTASSNNTTRRARSLPIYTYAHVFGLLGALKSVVVILVTLLLPCLRSTGPASVQKYSPARAARHQLSIPTRPFTLSMSPPTPKTPRSCLSPAPPATPLDLTFALDNDERMPSSSRPKLIRSRTAASVLLKFTFPRRKSSSISPLDRHIHNKDINKQDSDDSDTTSNYTESISDSSDDSSSSSSYSKQRPRPRSIDSFMSDASSMHKLVIKKTKVLRIGALKENALRMKRRATTMFANA